ncbi:hypothetical protein [Tenacibaculum maritimum]|uniref:hypothetical protein n=1 Tax=Tenacibaculum maritimum TaxID=107401 RepID=UPI003876D01F
MKRFFSGFVPIFLILAILFVVFFDFLKKVYLSLKGSFDRTNNISDFLDIIEPDYSRGISKKQANIYALQMLDSFNAKEPFYGTDESILKRIFSVIDSNDFKKIYNEFGQRNYNGFGSPPEGIFKNFDDYENRDLVYWLKKEVDSYWDRELYLLIKPIVEGSGFFF